MKALHPGCTEEQPFHLRETTLMYLFTLQHTGLQMQPFRRDVGMPKNAFQSQIWVCEGWERT